MALRGEVDDFAALMREMSGLTEIHPAEAAKTQQLQLLHNGVIEVVQHDVGPARADVKSAWPHKLGCRPAEAMAFDDALKSEMDWVRQATAPFLA